MEAQLQHNTTYEQATVSPELQHNNTLQNDYETEIWLKLKVL
ncbi:hypothetical protein TPMD03_77 [Thiohalocapsa phage LS06-2018-MD03]|nr:hypothetical protein TPMD03_77 [Thiohalocapsa phage LS06-2018-MD03]